MIYAIKPLLEGLRNVAFRVPNGPPTVFDPLVPPPGLESPELLPETDNGYSHLIELASSWPSEGLYPSDLRHRLKMITLERTAAEQALKPLRPILEQFESLPDRRAWQARITFEADPHDLLIARRFGEALLIRAELDRRPADRERALELARRLRRSQGTFMNFIVGYHLEKTAGGSFEGIEEDRRAAVHWELARMTYPFAHRWGPSTPVPAHAPASLRQQSQDVRWVLRNHPSPYDPVETAYLLLQHRAAMESGSSNELEKLTRQMAKDWPQAMHTAGGQGHVPLTVMIRLGKSFQSTPGTNPWGRLMAAQMLNLAAGMARLVVKADSERSKA